MATEQILALLIAERDKLNRAIEAIQGSGKRRGRPPGSAASEAASGEPGVKRFVSQASRRRMALAQKKRWAALKAKKS